ncbi:MAG: UbiH/UbiF/VisC/COQ6 family ubiquinone biosynthesis hydroxylase [Coxiellaceae bacterium]|nr:UbiH/UbiF/VisC/COQ6 family ubiquinone biosynthesis hydroxylase [Coxiellaceae bacterium]
MTQHSDLIILGAGMVGLTLALQCAQAGINVTVVDLQTPAVEWPEDSVDLRTVALNPSSAECLQRIGAWQRLKKSDVGIMQSMQVWDQVGGGEIDFDANAADQEALAFVIENRVLVRALWQCAEQQSHLTLIAPAIPKQLVIDDQQATLTLDNNKTLTANCTIGADGRNSWLKQQLAMTTHVRDYDHQAVVSIIETENPHNNTAFQAFLNDGPVGVLPLAHPHRLSVVWSTTPTHAQQLKQMDADRFAIDCANALGLKLGTCTLQSTVASIPLVERQAKNMVQARAAIVGDAAHTIHPLAGQGVNLGIADSLCLADTLISAKQAGKDLGKLSVLRQYERARSGPNSQMIHLMRLFKELFTDQSPLAVQSRNLGLKSANRLNYLKNCFIHYAS